MISPFVKYLRSRVRSVVSQNYRKLKPFHIFCYRPANRNIIHNDGNENFHKQKLKLNCSNKTLSLPTAQRFLNFMRTGFRMQTGSFLYCIPISFIESLVIRLARNV